MSLFQKSVVQKYLNDLDSDLINSKNAQFQSFFADPVRQENIRNSKEEQFQEGFLRELFVKVFGYTLNPEPDYNLTTEMKNIANSKKADGAILKGKDAVGVIELKGTDTTDLDKIETQAFGYKNHHPKCVYVITSNFEKLRFYIQNAVDHIDFDLFNLSQEDFSLMWLCLAKDNLLNGIPQKIKDSSLLQEENITKKLYADYSKFREEIYNNLVENNPDKDKLLLFKKTQKLLDRFLFIFFAEDRLLLPPNSISEIVKQWTVLKDELDEYVPLYNRFKKYFGYMNTGYKGKKYDIFAYNGGLFAPDEILDSISIDDEILLKHTLKLSQYDFETDVDVNILGHIFEHSLGEIENVQAEIKGEKIDTQKTKRKKDGIFYTPKYITKYIVENTVGKLCEEKRNELGIVDEEYAKGRRKRKKDTVKALDNKLTEYRNWLLSLTILDPACGSGAFLNQALDFLITEHRKIDDLRAQLLGGSIVFPDITTDILEKNIYGVDLNEESVEIAKLSLWLRTAQKGRKLNKLNNNIKCGNSLIDDPEVAGEKAFNWENEFPKIFQKKRKKAWHVTTATHNSRYSQRMFDNYVKLGSPVWLSDTEEIIVTETIAEIAQKDKLNILSYNICGDHMHIALVCEEDKLPKIVQKIKAMSARACNIAMGRTIPEGEHAPHIDNNDVGTREHASAQQHASSQRGKTQFHLWAEKFDGKEITSNEQLENTIAYIQNNRKKHQLPENKKAQKIAEEMCCTRQHAFRTEYTGGFDVVIGNPPYVNINTMPEIHEFLKNKYTEIHTGYNDLMYYFLFKGIDILKKSGLYGVITSNYFIGNDYADKLRLFLNKHLETIVNFEKTLIFEDANVHTTLVFAKKNTRNKLMQFYTYLANNSLKVVDLSLGYSFCELERKKQSNKWLIANNQAQNIIDKIHIDTTLLNDICEIEKGSTSGKNSIFTVSYEMAENQGLEKELLRKNVKNGDIDSYTFKERGFYLIYTDNDTNIDDYPKISLYLNQFKDELSNRNEASKGLYSWFRLERPRNKTLFDSAEKLIVPYRATCNRFAYDNQQFFNDGGDIRILALKKDVQFSIKYLLTLLNSKLLDWFYGFIGKAKGNAREYFNKPLSEIPIKNIPLKDQDAFILLADDMLNFKSELNQKRNRFIKRVSDNFNLAKINAGVENFADNDFKTFVKELSKLKIQLSLAQQDEWEDYFNAYKLEINRLQSDIEKTDKEIDQMVYELYGLTDDEIKIVENS